MPQALPVLMYHSISRYKHHLCVPPERFEDHCKSLAAAGWRGVSLPEAEEFFLKKNRLPRKTCLFTFDDGYFDNYVHAEPILRQYGHHGAIFPVMSFVEDRSKRRHNSENAKKKPDEESPFASLDSRNTTMRRGRRVERIIFCSWAELRHMQDQGNIAAAPHSMDHGRVVTGLAVTKLYRPRARGGFFAVPPYEALYGFPAFKLGHSLTDRGYRLVPELFDLIRDMVPQKPDEANAFLRVQKNYDAVIRAVSALPVLGVLESHNEYRSRISGEFSSCMELFRQKMGHAPVSFCWPWGSFNKTALEEAKRAGFQIFFTTGGKPSLCSSARAVYRISVREQSSGQLLQRLRFASGDLAAAAMAFLRPQE